MVAGTSGTVLRTFPYFKRFIQISDAFPCGLYSLGRPPLQVFFFAFFAFFPSRRRNHGLVSDPTPLLQKSFQNYPSARA